MIYSMKKKLIDLDLLGLHAILGQERRHIASTKQSSHGTYLNELFYNKHIQIKQIYISSYVRCNCQIIINLHLFII